MRKGGNMPGNRAAMRQTRRRNNMMMASFSDDDKNKNSQATPSGRPDTQPHARSSPTLIMATGPDGPMRQLIRAELDSGNAMNPYYKYFQGGNIHESLQTQNLCR